MSPLDVPFGITMITLAVVGFIVGIAWFAAGGEDQ